MSLFREYTSHRRDQNNPEQTWLPAGQPPGGEKINYQIQQINPYIILHFHQMRLISKSLKKRMIFTSAVIGIGDPKSSKLHSPKRPLHMEKKRFNPVFQNRHFSFFFLSQKYLRYLEVKRDNHHKKQLRGPHILCGESMGQNL